MPSFLEVGFPYAQLSKVILAERRSRDPKYGAHTWWARRPPALMRALLVGAVLDDGIGHDVFWEHFANSRDLLKGKTVFDPFVGGGTTAVEAERLGGDVLAADVDPLSVELVQYALRPVPACGFESAAEALLLHLAREFAALYPSSEAGGTPLHYFYAPEIHCPGCGKRRLLYRSLVLARDLGKPGAVVRDHPQTCFCPTCLDVHHLKAADQATFNCCGARHRIELGNFERNAFCCPECGGTYNHTDLETGKAPLRLLAVEHTFDDGRRRVISAPSPADESAIVRAKRRLSKIRKTLPLPTATMVGQPGDGRPVSYGLSKATDLHLPRQLLVLGEAFRWISEGCPEGQRTPLRLALSNSLRTNNRLCGYATDYGRLSALFSVRSYSLPLLSVELNPLHSFAGRGTLAACLRRVRDTAQSRDFRHSWDQRLKRVAKVEISMNGFRPSVVVRARSADEKVPERERRGVDLCVFDPPYFDYIRYDHLSAFHRNWLGATALAGEALLPAGDDPVGEFGRRLGEAMKGMVQRRRGEDPIVFTYHSSNPEAWEAVGHAIDHADLRVTALWPVKSDGHMGHHTYQGSCEWDLVVVCRPACEARLDAVLPTVDEWMGNIRRLGVNDADGSSMRLAWEMASGRCGRVPVGG